MPTHLHFVLCPTEDGWMSLFLRWVSLTPAMRYHAHYQTAGEGHVYQGRFKSFPVQDDEHFLTVCRYVERNAKRAGLVEHAEDWRWGSLYRWNQTSEPLPQHLSPWPIPRSPNWLQRVNAPLKDNELEQVRLSIRRGSPYWQSRWVESFARRLDFESTLRPRGCPKKQPPKPR